MPNNTSFPNLVTRSFPNGLERNVYFYGKLLTTRDFITEQNYFLAKHQLTHKYLHGIGVVWGLQIEDFSSQGIEKITFTLKPGIALDNQGREILVLDKAQHELQIPENLRGSDKLWIVISYHQSYHEPTPSGTTPKECHWNRIRENYSLEVLKSENDKGVVLYKIKKSGSSWELEEQRTIIESLEELTKDCKEQKGLIESLKEKINNIELSFRGYIDNILKRLSILERKYQKYVIDIGPEDKWQKSIKHKLGAYPTVDIYVYVPRRIVVTPPNVVNTEVAKRVEEFGEHIISEGNIGDFVETEQPEVASPRRRTSTFEGEVIRPILEIRTLRLTDRLANLARIKKLELTKIGDVPDKPIAELKREGFKMFIAGTPKKNLELIKPITVSHISAHTVHIQFSPIDRTKDVKLMVILRA